MAEHRAGEATEPPSDKKLRDAHRRGDVARSRELVAAAAFLVTAGVIAWVWPAMVGKLQALLRHTLASAPSGGLAPGRALEAGLGTLGWVVAPVLLAAMGAALLANFAQVRGVFTLHPVKPDLGRLSPARNIKQLVGPQAWIELCKSLLKIVGIGAIGVSVFWDHAPRLIRSLGATPEQLLALVGDFLVALTVRIGALALVLAAVDLLYQRHAYLKRQRMTRDEVKREQKELEGDPQHKAERDRLRREIAEHEMLEAVRGADCIVINPTELAVALRYDQQAMNAPRVVARGRRLMAAKIRELARRHGIPVIRDVPLARALVELELDEEIPPELYDAVAEILRFVYRLTAGNTPEDSR